MERGGNTNSGAKDQHRGMWTYTGCGEEWGSGEDALGGQDGFRRELSGGKTGNLEGGGIGMGICGLRYLKGTGYIFLFNNFVSVLPNVPHEMKN